MKLFGETGGLIAYLKSLFRRTVAKRLPKYTSDYGNMQRDSMVGTVRSEEQLEYNVRTNSYYVPSKFILKYNFPVKYIALYEDFGGDFAGIRYTGKVVSCRRVRRKRIPVAMSRNNPREIYFYFSVEEWAELPFPIAIAETSGGPPFFTSFILLNECRFTFELINVNSADQLRMAQVIDMLTDEENDSRRLNKINDRYYISRENGCLVMYKNGIDIYNVPVAEYNKNRRRNFKDFKTILSTDDILKKIK